MADNYTDPFSAFFGSLFGGFSSSPQQGAGGGYQPDMATETMLAYSPDQGASWTDRYRDPDPPDWAPWHPAYDMTPMAEREANWAARKRGMAAAANVRGGGYEPSDAVPSAADIPAAPSFAGYTPGTVPPVYETPGSQDPTDQIQSAIDPAAEAPGIRDAYKASVPPLPAHTKPDVDILPPPLPTEVKQDSVSDNLRRSMGPQMLGITQYAGLKDARWRDQNVNPTLRGKFSQLAQDFPDLKINSLYRDPNYNASVGGAKGSQHTHGNAVDIDVSGMSAGERVKLIARASELGFSGIGVYSNSVHLDIGPKRAWGPSYGSESVPKWAQETVKMHLGGKFLKNMSYQPPAPQAGRMITPQEYFTGQDVNKLPAGMRNNNPGNLKYSGSEFQKANYPGIMGPSKNLDQGTPQIVFSSPEAGMTAAVRLAKIKFDGGLNTVKSIITAQNGWTPGFDAAAENIAGLMGVKSTDKINLNEPATMRKFMRALITQEHGDASRLYPDALIDHGISRVLGGGVLQRTSAGGPTDAASAQQIADWTAAEATMPNLANNEWNADMAGHKAFSGVRDAGGSVKVLSEKKAPEKFTPAARSAEPSKPEGDLMKWVVPDGQIPYEPPALNPDNLKLARQRSRGKAMR